MERHEQENKNRIRPKTLTLDDFAPTTIQRPARSQHATNASSSRVDEAGESMGSRPRANRTRNSLRLQDTDSDDEILLNSRAGAKSSLKAKSKARSMNGSKRIEAVAALQYPKRTRHQSKPSAKEKAIPKKTGDSEGSITPLTKLLADTPANRALGIKRQLSGTTSRQNKKADKGGRDKHHMDTTIEEMVSSYDKTQRNPATICQELRPFPMHLSPHQPRKGTSIASSHVGESRSASQSTFLGSSSSSHSDNELNLVASRQTTSESDEKEEPSVMTYTQAIRVNDADPDSLCPFCDEPLPTLLSSVLSSRLEKLRQKATPQPRWGNKKGLKTSMDIYISFCTRHEAEATELPKGQKNGWPSELHPNNLADRVRKLEPELQALIDNPDEGTFFRPLQEAARKFGKHSITGAKGTWLSFENATTGYYGEQGFAVITQVLYDLFPDIPANKISPLEMSNYLSLVLVPETALLLIQHDLQNQRDDSHVSKSEALKVLHKSTKYGLAMFPVGEGEEDNAGDAFAWKRAMKMKEQREKETHISLSQSQKFGGSKGFTELSSRDGVTPKAKEKVSVPISAPESTKRTPSERSLEKAGIKKRKMKDHDSSQATVPQPLPSQTLAKKATRKINLRPNSQSYWSSSSAANTRRQESFGWLIDDDD